MVQNVLEGVYVMNEQKQIDYSQKGYTKPKEHYIYRVKFTKGEEVKFIGHLDIMRLFQRAIKRAKLPVAYSQGFNPHQLLSFANPLTLGTTSEGEYGDFEMAEKIEPAFVMNELNKTLPKGVKVLDSVLITQKVQSAMASIDGAKYIVYTDKKLTEELLQNNIDKFLAQKEILVMKKTKNNEKITDIRKDIFDMKNMSDEKGVKIYLYLAAGSRRNLKPEPVIKSFYEYLELEFEKYCIKYHRLDLMRREEGKGWLALGEEIGFRCIGGKNE